MTNLLRAGCCCAEDCEHCEGDTTPASFRVTLSGWAICPDCYDGTAWSVNPVPALQGSYILPQSDVLGPCIWELNVPLSAGTWINYEQDDCTGDENDRDAQGLFIRVEVSAAEMQIIITYLTVELVLLVIEATTTPCDGTTVFNLTRTCGPASGSPWQNGYSGGTVTVTRV